VPNNSFYLEQNLTHLSTMPEHENFGTKEIKLFPESRAATIVDNEGLDERKFTVINRISDQEFP